MLRKRLVQLAQVETWTEEVSLRGRIPAINQDKLGFQLELRDGIKLPAPLTEQHWDAVLDAVNGYRAGAHVLIGWRQLSWPLGDNYLGRWKRGANLIVYLVELSFRPGGTCSAWAARRR